MTAIPAQSGARHATIECDTCGRRVALVRSVRIRQWIGPAPEGSREAFQNIEAECVAAGRGIEGADRLPPDMEGGVTPDDPRYEAVLRWDEQHRRDSEFRRAFLCPDCYSFLDNYWGSGVIVRDGKARRWNLNGASRRGKAAVYNYRKWVVFQQKKASEMGIAFEG